MSKSAQAEGEAGHQAGISVSVSCSALLGPAANYVDLMHGRINILQCTGPKEPKVTLNGSIAQAVFPSRKRTGGYEHNQLLHTSVFSRSDSYV